MSNDRNRQQDRLAVARPRWSLRPPPDAAKVRTLQRKLKLPEALCRLLATRGLLAPTEAKSFLRPLLGELHDPAMLLGAETAASRIVQAIQNDELVFIHGDYDVDGISGSALLVRWIHALGGRAEGFVPHRLRDGYDLTRNGVAKAVEVGAGILVTVDCGIRAGKWTERAQDEGIEVIVTDHHRPGSELPPSLTVVNPNQPDCDYPNKNLCGAGVAFKVGQLVAAQLGRSPEEAWERLDLVGLATIADQVSLEGENRVLASYGLRVARETKLPGLAALIQSSCGERPLDSVTVAFQLAPRINAAGRVGEAASALRLLLTDDDDEAKELANTLEDNNQERRTLDREIHAEAIEQVAANFDPAHDRGLVVAGEGWHPGVTGIVASRLGERIFRPVIVVAMDGNSGRGSARSIPTFDVHEALEACSKYLLRFGGHHQAAGMEVQREQLPLFQKAFAEVARERIGREEPRPLLEADMEIRLEEIDEDFFHYLRYLGPFGRDNPEPVLVVRGAKCAYPTTPKGHLRFRLEQGEYRLPAIGFGLGERHQGTLLSGSVDVAFHLSENTYMGRTTIQAQVLDLRAAT